MKIDGQRDSIMHLYLFIYLYLFTYLCLYFLKEHYPVNFLRNVALTFNDSSRYVFLNDIDFVPDTNIENMLLLYLDQPEMINARQVRRTV